MTMMMTMVKAPDDSGAAPRRAPQDTSSISRCEQTVRITRGLFRLLLSSGGVPTPFPLRSAPIRADPRRVESWVALKNPPCSTFLPFPSLIPMKIGNAIASGPAIAEPRFIAAFLMDIATVKLSYAENTFCRRKRRRIFPRGGIRAIAVVLFARPSRLFTRPLCFLINRGSLIDFERWKINYSHLVIASVYSSFFPQAWIGGPRFINAVPHRETYLLSEKIETFDCSTRFHACPVPPFAIYSSRGTRIIFSHEFNYTRGTQSDRVEATMGRVALIFHRAL